MIQASKKQLINTMNYIIKLLIFIYQTRKSWWYTATCRTKARFIRTFLGSFWLGLSNLLSIAVLAGVYGTVFKVANFKDYSILIIDKKKPKKQDNYFSFWESIYFLPKGVSILPLGVLIVKPI